MKTLLFLIVLSGLAYAGPSTTFLWSPAPPLSGTNQGFISNGAGVSCASFIPAETITATSLTFYITVAGDSGDLCTLGIYSANGASLLASTGPQACDSLGVKQVTGLTPFTLTAGVKYQKCGCVTKANAQALAIRALYRDRLRNTLSVPLVFNAANSCTAGSMPATLGSFSGADGFEPFVLIGTGTP